MGLVLAQVSTDCIPKRIALASKGVEIEEEQGEP